MKYSIHYPLIMATNHLKNTLRRHRYLSGEMTQRDLAERVGVSRQSIIAIEQGKFRPSVELALRMAVVFGTRVEDLFQLNHEGETP